MGTPPSLKLILYTILIGFMANTTLILIENINMNPEFKITEEKSEKEQCCIKMCEKDARSLWLKKVLNYTEVSKMMPKLDPSYKATSIRFGTDLDFDFSQCPPKSIMLNRAQDFSPKHFDCPTLFLVGARKAGTTSLYHYISKHPDFHGTRLDAGPKSGETFYFSHFYTMRTWKQYLSLFPSGDRMTGESSVGNLVQYLAPHRLYESCGKQAKVIMLFRDPITRLESNFLMRARLNSTRFGPNTAISTVVKLHLDLFFEQALRRTMDVKNLPKHWNKLVNLFPPAQNMVYEGLYYVHLLNWMCNFPAENILIIKSEDFYRNSSRILDIVISFLGLKRLDSETYDWITSSVYNKGKYDVPSYQKLSTADKASLLGLYKPFNNALLSLLQWEPSEWHH